MRKLLFTLLSAFLPLAIWGAGYSFLSPKLDEVDQTHEPDVATLSAEASEVTAGEISNLTVSLENGDLVCNGYQFVLKLPEGITLAFDEEEDDWVYSLTNRYTKIKSMQFTVSDKGNGEYQILCYSMTNETITGSEGSIVTLGLQTDPSLAGGTYNCSLNNAIVSTVD